MAWLSCLSGQVAQVDDTPAWCSLTVGYAISAHVGAQEELAKVPDQWQAEAQCRCNPCHQPFIGEDG